MKKKNEETKTSTVVVSDNTATYNIDRSNEFLDGLIVEKKIYDRIKEYEEKFLTDTVRKIAKELGTVRSSDAVNLHGTAKINDYTTVEVAKTPGTNPVVVVRNSYDITEHTLDVLDKLKQIT